MEGLAAAQRLYDRREPSDSKSGPDHSYRTPRHVLERIEREYRVMAKRRAGWVARKKKD